MNDFNKLVKAQDEYITLLVKEIESMVSIAYTHGWRSDNHEAGVMLREKIAGLKQETAKEEQEGPKPISSYLREYSQLKEYEKLLGGGKRPEYTLEMVRAMGWQEVLHMLTGYVDILNLMDRTIYVLEEGAGEWEIEAGDWKWKFEMVFAALKELTDLKAIKAQQGETPDYLERKPKAWEVAKQLTTGYKIEKQEQPQYDLTRDPLNAIRTAILKHCSPEDMVWLRDWLGTYNLPAKPAKAEQEGPWKYEVHHEAGLAMTGCSGGEYVTVTDGKVVLYIDVNEGEEYEGEVELCQVLNKYKIKVDYNHEAEMVADFLEKELKRVNALQREQEGLRWVKGHYDQLYEQVKRGTRTVCYVDYFWNRNDKSDPIRDICTIKPETWEFGSRGVGYGGAKYMKGDEKENFIQLCKSMHIEWLDESGLASSREREVAIAFAEWISQEPHLFGNANYGWYYDIPIDGAGVEHKLIGDTNELYDLYLQSTNK